MFAIFVRCKWSFMMGNLCEGVEGQFGDTNLFCSVSHFQQMIWEESSSISKSLKRFRSMRLKQFFTLKFTFILTLKLVKCSELKQLIFFLTELLKFFNFLTICECNTYLSAWPIEIFSL